ncbi:MAG: hypothetical protein OJF49_001912 [Ktedonobacterales bacterium]|jgi:hypothetical protein|nr:MAG: hypothetical protein OJF49_001912 [Ktedonobacterales bacterium]
MRRLLLLAATLVLGGYFAFHQPIVSLALTRSVSSQARVVPNWTCNGTPSPCP